MPLLLFPVLPLSTCAAAAALDEVVEEFLGGSVHAGLPPGFPRVTLPADLQVSVVGTLAAGNIVQVLLEAPGTSAASAALREAYVAAGWIDLSTNSVIVRLCHATHGSLQIMPASRTQGRLRVLHSPDNLFSGDPAAQGCARQPVTGTQSWYSWITERLPVLSVPPQTKPVAAIVPPPRPAIVSGKTNGAGGLELMLSVTQENVIEVPDINVAGLDAHFAARMSEQGWQRDSGGSSQRSATSVWYRIATATSTEGADTQEVVLTGTLTLHQVQDDAFHVGFAMQGTVETPFPVGSVTFVRDIMTSGCMPLNDPQIGIRGVPAGSVGSRICRL
ncbi:MAG: hypothetical protein ACO1PZ_13185 [Gammaproteobacteria bacterium]